jgi:hypothetical protein
MAGIAVERNVSWTVWVLTAIVALALLADGAVDLVAPGMVRAEMEMTGFPANQAAAPGYHHSRLRLALRLSKNCRSRRDLGHRLSRWGDLHAFSARGNCIATPTDLCPAWRDDLGWPVPTRSENPRAVAFQRLTFHAIRQIHIMACFYCSAFAGTGAGVWPSRVK